MTPKRLFFYSLIAIGLSVFGFMGIIFLCFAFFTYQGNGMDWIYPVGGLFVLLGMGSVVVAGISGVLCLIEERDSKR
jgi:hypothetical protein